MGLKVMTDRINELHRLIIHVIFLLFIGTSTSSVFISLQGISFFQPIH